MAFGAKTDGLAAEKPKALGLDAKKAATHEQARPLPYFVGKSPPIAGTFIAEPFNTRSDPVSKRTGKKSSITGYRYTTSFVVIFCHGPVDTLNSIYIGNDLAWEGPVSRLAEPFVEITVESKGLIRFYWGGEDQTIDPSLEASGQVHSAYRGQCYAVFIDWQLAEGQVNVDNIQVLLERFPAPSFWPSEIAREIEGDANPVLAISELWEHPRYGIGSSLERLDTDSLLTVAESLIDEGFGFSPYVNSAATFGAFLAKWLDYVGGYVSMTPDGRMGIGLERGTIGTPPTINTTDLVGIPEITQRDWSDTFNSISLKFSNRNIAFNPDAVSWRDSANFAIVGATLQTSVNREWITRQYAAWLAVVSVGRQLARPRIEGSIKVQLESGLDLQPGSQFYLTYSGHNMSSVLCRVVEWNYPGPDSPHIVLRFVEDLGFLNAALSPVDEDDFGDPLTFEAAEAYDQRAFEIPWRMSGTREVTAAIQVIRGDTICNGYNAFWEVSEANFVQQGRGDAFAQKGTLAADFSAEVLIEDPDVVLDVTFTSPDTAMEDLTRTEAFTNRSMHIYIGGEIMIAWEPTLVASGRWTFRVARAQYDTLREDHAEGDEVWLTREDPTAVFTQVVPDIPTTNAFKAQPFVMGNAVELVACPTFELDHVRRAYAPLAPTNATVNDEGVNPTYGTGDDIDVDWTETSESWVDDPEVDVGSRADSTIIQILDALDVVVDEITVAGVAGTYTIPNADLVTALGSETDFSVRVFYSLAGVRSINYSGVRVTKV